DLGFVDARRWAEVCQVALALFARGTALAARGGLILVDTKYEFGLIDGQLVLIDEVHTPDSSRYWIKDTYAARRAAGRDPEQFDKEHLRLWLHAQGYHGEGPAPRLADDIVTEVAARYLDAFERLTGKPLTPGAQPASARIINALAGLTAKGA
ncbi:MAG: phosphoribosylaminoimidazolesuccinocarboxamide synthase, partial [Myxococcales bacterium]|nr:phosphoribosylaminoimidazolesuccinocarboxamide synthase [Myxococcales bacterium]